MELQTDELKMELSSEKRIQFNDCDGFGHLNNAAYLNYFMNTREEQLLETYSLSFPEIYRNYGAGWVVAETRIVYLAPAKYGDRVTITTRVTQVRKSSVIVEGVMSDDNQLHSIASVNFVWVDLKSGRPRSHPPEIRELMQQIDTGLTPNGLADFSDRVKGVRDQMKRSRKEGTPAADAG